MTIGDFLLILLCAFVLGAGATPLMRRVALQLRMLDYPTARKIHSLPVPLLGGVAIYAAVVIPLLLVYSDRREVVELAGTLLGATIVSLAGLWDDRGELSPAVKLSLQLAAAVLLYVAGVRIQLPLPEMANLTLTLIWVLVITNAFNLLDNIDGLCGGVAAMAGGFFLLFALLNGQDLVGAFAAALLGASIAFLIYNFNPARIFMGDVGSLFIGFLMSALSIKIRFPGNTPWVTWMVPVLVLGMPIFDTALVFVSRLRRRVNPLTNPGTDHVSHRLMQLGWTARGTALLLYLVSFALGALGVLVSLASLPWAYAVGTLVGALSVFALLWFERRQATVDPCRPMRS